jgi:hypothetical protein
VDQELGVLRGSDDHDGGVEVTLVLPAYNEASRIETAVVKAEEALTGAARSFEIIIAEDGSSDGTDEIAERLSREHSFVRHLHGEERLGRGRALRAAFRASRGSILAYMDVDLSTDIRFLVPLIDCIRAGYDLATGSRMLPGSVVERSRLRRASSWTYNTLARTLLRTGVRDHQCGFKAFSRKSLLDVLDRVEADGWFWDTEIIAIEARTGLRIKEIPVVWREMGGKSKVRLMSDSITMGLQVLGLLLRLMTIGHDHDRQK